MNRLGSGDDINNIPVTSEEDKSLLNKYDIPIDHLDFEYVKKCNNGKELEQILHILQSGQEGHYPDLMKCTEGRLAEVNPFSKRLRKQAKVLTKDDIQKDEWKHFNGEVEDWIKTINKNDKELLTFKNVTDDYTDVPIRDSKISSKKVEKPNRIRSMDYDKWDKLDVDAEMLKMDLQEEKMKVEQQKILEQKEKLNTIVVQPDYMTEAERQRSALEEKNRGNEFYKSGDYEEALNYYTNSLNLLPRIDAYNNRAITYIKLNQFENAINDCNEVLKTEPSNQKALLRKALALKNLKHFDKAANCLQKVIEKDPNNNMAQNMMKTIVGKLPKKPTKSIRFNIQEVKSSPQKIEKQSLKESKNLLVPIPGTSCDNPPFYKIVNVSNEMEEKYKKTCRKTIHPSDENVINLNEINKAKSKVKEIVNEKQRIEKTKNTKEQLDSRSQNGCSGASGEPIKFDPDEISPYGFTKYWQAIRSDKSLRKLEQILRTVEPTEISAVIGNKLDGEMLGLVLESLHRHFLKREDVTLVVNILEQFVKLPRFCIISMLMSPQEKKIAKNILDFVSSLGHNIGHLKSLIY